MIKLLTIKNFKSFLEQSLELKPLTVLAGINSSGKSSVLQAIRIWHDNELLNGHGSAEELISSVAESRQIAINITFGNNMEKSLTVDLDNKISPMTATRSETYSLDVYPITALRLGPQNTLPVRSNEFLDNKAPFVGEDGCYVIEVLNFYRDYSGVPEKLRGPGAGENSGLVRNINYWLNQISPDFKVDFDTMPLADVGRLGFSNHRSSNVGFGLTYVLPIILQVLACSIELSKNNEYHPVILLENPEAHLHPKGQTIMGCFLAQAAACGIQCILETHSDHLFDGVRLAIKDELISCNDVMAYYFEYDLHDEKSKVTTIFLDQFGMCDNWPEGFFDENTKNLMRLV